MTMKELYTSFEGRIGRQQFWLGVLTLAVIVTLIGVILVMLFGTKLPPDPEATGYSVGYSLNGTGSVLALILSVFYTWAGLAVSIKRWHDRDKSGWWVLINLVPVIGGLWALVETGFLKGTDGPNRFGGDPLAR